MKSSTMAAVLLVIGLIVGGGVGYGAFALTSSPQKTTSPTISGCTQSTTNSTETCTLGVVFPLTSSLSAFGKSFVQGVNLAVSQMNANLTQSGSNVRFATAVSDDQGTPAGALTAVTNLYTTDNVHVVIGPLTTAEVQGALQYAQSNHILLLPPASSGTALDLPVFGNPDSYLIRPGQPGDQFESSALGQTIYQIGIKYAVFIYSSDTSEAGTYNLTSSYLQQNGVKTTGIEVQPLQSDYTSAVAQANTQAQTYLSSGGTVNDTAIVLCEHGTDAAEIFSEASTQTTLPTLHWFGIEALNDNNLLSNSAVASFMNKVHLTITTLYTPSSPQGRAFLSNFQAVYGTPPEPFTNYAYDVTWIAMLSILAAGSYNAQALLPMVLVVSDHFFGSSGTPSYVDPLTGSQSIAYFAIDKIILNGTNYEFTQIGLYDGSSNTVTLTSK